MWPEIFDFITTSLAVSCCAFAVKLADDYLDQEYDKRAGRANFAYVLGKGTMFYAMLLMIIAAALNMKISLSLFLASYIVGMFNDFNTIFPLGLTGWQETSIILLLSSALFGIHLTSFALMIVTAVQLLDDCIDVSIDRRVGQRNFACRFGVFECLLTAILCLLASWWLGEMYIGPVLTGTALSYASVMRWQVVRTSA